MDRAVSLRAAVTTILVFGMFACRGSQPEEPLPRGDGPSLIVVISVDQMRSDYIERFRDEFTGGLGWILDRGIVYSNAHQNHAATSTSPGHATIATGVEPARSGIIENSWYDRETGLWTYSADVDDQGSPIYLEVDALGDWLKAHDPRSLVFTASAKDRSAVMLGGQRPDAAYWYDEPTGTWTGSHLGRGPEREWVTELNDSRWLDQFFGIAWEPLDAEPPSADLGLVAVDTGVLQRDFPHVLGGSSVQPGSSFYRDVYESPWIDEYLAELAKRLLDNEPVGRDGSVDFLGLSFSALDTAAGHDYGPDSPEALDVLRRLDRLLDDLLAHLDRTVGLRHVVLALSGDHGVVRLPEVRQQLGLEGRRLGPEDYLCMQQAGGRLVESFGPGDWIARGLYLNDEFIAQSGVDKDEVVRTLAAAIEGCEAVERVWTTADIESLPTDADTVAERYRNNHFPSRGPDLHVQHKPFYLDDEGLGTTHGSVYDYDSGVPVVFVVPGTKPKLIDRRVATADIAPTLGALVGVAPTSDVDGVDLTNDFERDEPARPERYP